MDIQTLSIELKSKNPLALAEFLSEILDQEYQHNDEHMNIQVANTVFKISNHEDHSKFQKSYDIEMQLCSNEEFENISKKIDFYNYRHAKVKNKSKIENLTDDSLCVIDPDGRSWKFKLPQ